MEMVQTQVEKPSFETVWIALQENAAQQKETDRLMREYAERQQENAERQRQEFEREKQEAAERQKEFEQRRQAEAEQRQAEFKQWEKKWDKILKRNSKQMGDLNNKFGKLAEHLVAPGIAKRFNELGYHFNEVAPGGKRIFDEKSGKIKTEIDLLLENGEAILAVEVKVTPALKDIEHHLKRLEILRDHRRSLNDQRKVLGAIAGAIFGTAEKQATADAGLYVIEQSGDTMKIDIPDGFVPRVW